MARWRRPKPAFLLSSPVKIEMIAIVCVMALLTACGPSDQYSFVPEVLRQPRAEPPQPEPEPDVKELVRIGADTLFTVRPSAVSVSRPRRITGTRFSACVQAIVPSAIDGKPRPATLVVMIEHGKLTERHRATAYDGYATEHYEKIEAAR